MCIVRCVARQGFGLSSKELEKGRSIFEATFTFSTKTQELQSLDGDIESGARRTSTQAVVGKRS